MDVSLTILFDAAGVPTCAYCGQDATAALEALEAAGLTGKFAKGYVVKSPDYLKKRTFEVAPAAPAAPAVEAKKGK